MIHDTPVTIDQERADEIDYLGRAKEGFLTALAKHADDPWGREVVRLELERRARLETDEPTAGEMDEYDREQDRLQREHDQAMDASELDAGPWYLLVGA